VVERLGINVIIRGQLEGSVVFNAQQEVAEDQLFIFLEALLDQFGYAITLDPDTGFYVITSTDQLVTTIQKDLGTTRIIPTPSVRPSSLQTALSAIFGGTTNPRAAAAGASGGVSISYVDDLGVILVSGPPRRLSQVEALVQQLLAEYAKQEFFKVELEHVAAPAARQRLVELVSRTAGGGAARGVRAANAEAAAIISGGSSLDNLAERLTADPSSNALIFRGLEQEADQVRQLIRDIDRPTLLVPRKYFAGSASRQIADIASQRGLGEVITLDSGTSNNNRFSADLQRAQQLQRGLGTNAQTVSGGSAMVVDETNGTIIYYGTEAQQTQLAALIDQLDTDAEIVVIKEYKLQYADAEVVADLLNSLINNERQTVDAPLLGTDRSRDRRLPAERILDAAREADIVAATEGGGITLSASEDLFVIADVDNNQLLVKAPMRQQEELETLIGKIDLQRAQVYVEATIVTVSNTESARLAIEGAINNANGDPIIQSLFGLTNAGDNILSPRTVSTGLPGLTTAVIGSDFVPFVLTAIQTDTDARIISTPQLLVNDNVEASISSTQSEPTTTTQVGETSDITSFGGFEDATTSLDIRPTISSGGQLILEYTVALQDFVGSGADGIPPPRISQDLTGSVTLPDNTTVVVGGITTSDLTETVDKIPLLGDIPLIGQLFRDTSRTEVESLLYVFITPRIMRDPNFRDLRLLTRGPQTTSAIPGEFPEMDPVRIPVLDVRSGTDLLAGRPALPTRAEQNLPPANWSSPIMTPTPTQMPAPTLPELEAPTTIPLDAPIRPANEPANPWVQPNVWPSSTRTELAPSRRTPSN
ncbi:MAG: secretin N-terminal domain-containing protein, partial [Planctomycetota bacterium]